MKDMRNLLNKLLLSYNWKEKQLKKINAFFKKEIQKISAEKQ